MSDWLFPPKQCHFYAYFAHLRGAWNWPERQLAQILAFKLYMTCLHVAQYRHAAYRWKALDLTWWWVHSEAALLHARSKAACSKKWWKVLRNEKYYIDGRQTLRLAEIIPDKKKKQLDVVMSPTYHSNSPYTSESVIGIFVKLWP